MTEPAQDDSRLPARLSDAFAAEALASDRQALRIRLIALVLIALLILAVSPWPYSLYYHAFLPLFALTGYLNTRLRRRHWPALWPSYLMVMFDAVLLTVILLVPNPAIPAELAWPIQIQLRFGNFAYFYVFTVALAFSYSPRLVLWGACVVAASWTTGVTMIYLRDDTLRITDETTSRELLSTFLSPGFVDRGVVLQEVVIYLIISAALATFVWRSRQVALREARIERQRANLARYFSPNVVATLSEAGEPLQRGRTQRAAVLFADIVGFTRLAEAMAPEQTLELLQVFHGKLARAVFDHGGTLDKFIGDGLMATFGTPIASNRDAADAVACVRSILEAMDAWNDERARAGLPPIRVGLGCHAGPVVLGNIGDERRLEFAVIGDTVNVASRLERLSRSLDTALVLSAETVDLVRQQVEPAVADDLLRDLVPAPKQDIRGRDEEVAVFTHRPGAAVGQIT